jgi:hypothetical protein
MTMVRVIFPEETTFPVRIRPRMETSPVKGHFLSAWPEPISKCTPLASREEGRGKKEGLTDVGPVDGLGGGLEAKTDLLVPPLGLGGNLLSA